MSDYAKHKGPWLPGMMVIDHGLSRRGRVHSVICRGPVNPDFLICISSGSLGSTTLLHGIANWSVGVGPWLSADLSDESTRRLIASLAADQMDHLENVK